MNRSIADRSPADYVIESFGGIRPTARVLGCSPSSICKWKRKRLRRRKGLIPIHLWDLILKKAKAKHIHITLDHLFYGRR